MLVALLSLGFSLAACGEEGDPTAVQASPTPTAAPPTPTLAPPLQIAATQTAIALDESLPTLTPTATPTPTPIPPPEELLPLAKRNLDVGDTATAADQYSATLQDERTNESQREEALYHLALAELGEGHAAQALSAFEQYLAAAATPNPNAYFFTGQLSTDAATAVDHYRTYLAANPDMLAYVQPRIAARIAAQGDTAGAVDAYRAALNGESHYLVAVETHRQLAELLKTAGDYSGAIEQYAAIRALAQTETTRGEMTYLIGSTYILSGSLESGYQAYQTGLRRYPEAYETYLGLVALLEAEQPVDEYLRGVVDYHAAAYAPAVEALNRYVQADSGAARPDAYLYLAWSYEAIGDFENALAALDAYLATAPDDTDTLGTYYAEKAALLTRSISTAEAVTTLDEFTETHPEHPQRAWALWRAAVLTDRFLGDAAAGIERYATYAEAYPHGENAAAARFRVGTLEWERGNVKEAAEAWQAAAADTGSEFGRAALVWLLKTAPAGSQPLEVYRAQAAALAGDDYYSIRARDLAAGRAPYAPAGTFDLSYAEAAARREVENWLRTHFGLGSDAVVTSEPAPVLAQDGRLVRGTKLWQLGLFAAARWELEAVRAAYADNAQLSYQLALYFRDLGAYRSSILAAAGVLRRAEVSVFEAPGLLGRLAYPVYYSDIIVPLAEKYGYDPLLQFAQIRQESLFESFAASSAAAQGLTQIIPDTGAFIAQRLGWPDYENADLYRPYLNLTFGAYYLDQQLAGFDGNVTAALAAYNAGPGNAAQWYAVVPDDHDLYLETVNFAETRLYIRNIYAGQAIYTYLYEQAD